MSRRLPGLTSVLALAATVVAAQTVTAPGVHPISGRRFASVMGWQGADWLERSEREREEEPNKALEALGDLTGATVADMGPGPATSPRALRGASARPAACTRTICSLKC